MKVITLDKARNVRFGMKALSMIEKKMGKPLAKLDLSELTIEDLMVVIWAGLVWEDPELTPEKLLDIVDAMDMPLEEVINMLGEALNESFAGSSKNVPKAAQ